VLYGVVRSHLETFLAHARESYDAPLPRYVEQELRAYLRCGVFAHRFVRARCERCGYDLLVAFSCKHRGVCPSCAGRRMANTAAHLVDRVVPAVPVRQWVLSLPFELRALAAFRADVLSALARAFVESVLARHRTWAKHQGLTGEAPSGAVTFVQRFGSSVNLNVHFHTMVLDGVFTRDAQGRPVFHCAPPPAPEELNEVVKRVHRRAVVWLHRNELPASTREDPNGQQPAGQTFLAACATIAMQRGSVRALPHEDDAPSPERDARPDRALDAPPTDGAVEFHGFNLQASVRIVGDDDLGRERLLRYGARPALSLDRLRQLPGARIAYRIKRLRGGRSKHRVMTPLEFLARLAALVPPPRYPLLRYHGVLGPRSRWRRDIVPKAPPTEPCRPHLPQARDSETAEPEAPSKARKGAHEAPTGTKAAATRKPVAVAQNVPTPATHGRALAASRPREFAPPGQAALLAPNILSVKHRLLGGLLYAASPRVDWATLLRRTFEVDVLACAHCGGRLRVLGESTEPSMVRLILESLGLHTEAPVAARARDPTDLLGDPDAN
jgi:hypothetical protein